MASKIDIALNQTNNFKINQWNSTRCDLLPGENEEGDKEGTILQDCIEMSKI